MKLRLPCFWVFCWLWWFMAGQSVAQPQAARFVPGKWVLKLHQHAPPLLAKLKGLPYMQSIRPLLETQPGQLPLYEIDIDPQAEGHFKKFLQTKREVAYIEPVPYAQPMSGHLPNDPLLTNTTLSWAHYRIKAPEAWELSKGDSGIVVGLVDTDFDIRHPDLRDRVYYNPRERYGRPNVDDDNNGCVDDSLGCDFARDGMPLLQNHGTHVAGIIGATPNNGIGTAGIGYHNRLMQLKVLRFRNGGFQLVDVYRAVLFAAYNGCRIVNMSLGQSITRLQWEQDVITHVSLAKNVLVVAAAGNDGRETEFFPAAYDHVLSVGATDRNDRRDLGGSFHYSIDLTAPGVDVQTTGLSSPYMTVTGSSFAAPYVSGAAALVMARFPQLRAQQVSELLRVTSDDIYNISENRSYADKLGRGRLNVFRALSEANTAQAMRLRTFTATNRLNAPFGAGDTVRIAARFVNVLKPATAAANVKILSDSRYVEVLRANYSLANLGTLDSTTNNAQPFLIRLKADTPPSERIWLKLEFTDAGYTDYQYISIITAPYFLNVEVNQWSLSMAANGRLGRVDQANQDGLGLVFGGERLLNEAGLMLAASGGRVSDAVIGEGGLKSQDIVPLQHPRIDQRGLQFVSAKAAFQEAATLTNPIGVKIDQTLYGRINSPHQRYFMVHYDVTNTSATMLDSVLVALYADWNIGGAGNFADWDGVEQIGYAYRPSGLHAGIKTFGGDGSIYYALDRDPFPDLSLNVADGFAKSEKYWVLTGGVSRQQAGRGTGNDVAHVVGARLRNLGPGEKRRLTFVFAAGNSLSDLRAAMGEAAIWLNPLSTKAPRPILPSAICAAPTMRVEPLNGNNFRFYKAENLAEPAVRGRALSLSMADTSQLYYISNVDGQIESDLVPFKLRPHFVRPAFTSIDSLNLADSSVVQFTDRSIDPVTLSWNFGDGTVVSNVRNPRHNYRSPGVYTVTLTIIDGAGCFGAVSRVIRVVRLARSPRPTLPEQLYACKPDPITVSPTNGTRFRFYLSPPPAQPVATGNSYVLRDTSIRTVFVTSIDSVFESLPAQVAIRRSTLKANFTYSPKADTIIFEQINFRDLSTGDNLINKWDWDFGDGRKSFSQNPTHTYRAQGVYTVTLRVADVRNCTDSIKFSFRVGRRGPLPQTSDLELCLGDSATIRPGNNGSRFNFYTSANAARPIHTGRFYKFLPSASTSIFVANADSIVESAWREVKINLVQMMADFEPQTTALMNDNGEVQFNNLSTNAMSLIWDFGDGTTLRNVARPSHRYRAQGRYTVRLTATNALGCTATRTREILVARRGPRPTVSDRLVCAGETVNIAPQNGSRFNFYTSPTLNFALASGSTWAFKADTTTTVYVTNADSLAESLPATLTIRVNPVSAQFGARGSRPALAAGDTVFFTAPNGDQLSNFNWDFGNGQGSLQRNPWVVYAAPGRYRVSLTVRNTSGCTATHTQTIDIAEPLSSGQATQSPYRLRLWPNPTPNGQAVLSLQMGKPQSVRVALYNALGQQLATFATNGLLENDWPLALQPYPAGLYLLHVHIGEHRQVLRLIKE